MLEFTLNSSRNGKKSRWAKKYPRKRILKRGSEKAAGWYPHNWYDDSYHYFGGDLHKFLLANIGRPVDKVFSEFLKRCRRGTEKYNLRDKFYVMFKEKSDIDYSGGFYITNGIVNYKKRTKRPTSKPYTSMEDFNRATMPALGPICRVCDTTHTKQFLGIFRLAYDVKKRVYIVERSVFDSDLELQTRYKPCSIYAIGEGISEIYFASQYKVNSVSYQLYSNWYDQKPDSKYMFITRI